MENLERCRHTDRKWFGNRYENTKKTYHKNDTCTLLAVESLADNPKLSLRNRVHRLGLAKGYSQIFLKKFYLTLSS